MKNNKVLEYGLAQVLNVKYSTLKSITLSRLVMKVCTCRCADIVGAVVNTLVWVIFMSIHLCIAPLCMKVNGSTRLTSVLRMHGHVTIASMLIPYP